MHTPRRSPSNPELQATLHQPDPQPLLKAVGSDQYLVKSNQLNLIEHLLNHREPDPTVHSVNRLIFPLDQSTHSARLDGGDVVEDVAVLDVSDRDSPIQYIVRDNQLVEELFFQSSDSKDPPVVTVTKYNPGFQQSVPAEQMDVDVPYSSRGRQSGLADFSPDFRGSVLRGVNLFVYDLQVTLDCFRALRAAEERQLNAADYRSGPNVINLNSQVALNKTVRPQNNWTSPSPPPKSRSSSRSRTKRVRSRSASPRHLGFSRRGEIRFRLDVSVPLSTTTHSHRTCLTTSLLFHRDNRSRTDQLVPEFVGKGGPRTIRFAHGDSDHPVAFVELRSLDNLLSGQHVRFSVFTVPPTGRPENSTTQSISRLVCLNHLALEDVRTAVLAKKHWRSNNLIRMFTPLFSSGTEISNLERKSGVGPVLLGRIELKLEPVWISNPPTDSHLTDQAHPVLSPPTLNGQTRRHIVENIAKVCVYS
ncbi:hypothetical protein EG68_10760 [Paragonimus skrjabini miyazakii]|uniref:Uncharacterized protein n=1 Tax=Paragonimus skrjabini miyazakii TaxID=59628 RepID=A0A8S9YS08_9TREM|nr:hypothetical protein EG68_10760 [Paragonimus skrjabini miyazakii]